MNQLEILGLFNRDNPGPESYGAFWQLLLKGFKEQPPFHTPHLIAPTVIISIHEHRNRKEMIACIGWNLELSPLIDQGRERCFGGSKPSSQGGNDPPVNVIAYSQSNKITQLYKWFNNLINCKLLRLTRFGFI